MVDNSILWPGWETVRLTGRGSFGAVYEIQRQVFDDVEKAALKVITIPQNASDIEELYSDGYNAESITATFQAHLKSIVAEYSLMRKMNGCANVVSCDDVRYVQHDDGIGWDIFIKMELLTPLTKALPDKIPEEAAMQIARDMCAALVLCEKHGIVHRDIKPQNIFVSPNGDYKLGDFGIAKTVEKTMGGTKIGTYKYMAPEVYNNQPYGHGADIYSLGLVLYWLLNERRLPFLPLPPANLKAGMDEQARLRRFAGEVLPAPAHGSDELKRIVLKACAFDPRERYNTAAQMLEELELLGRPRSAGAAGAVPNLGGVDMPQDDGTVGPCFQPAITPARETDVTAEEDGTVGAENDATVGPVFRSVSVAETTPTVYPVHASGRKHFVFVILLAALWFGAIAFLLFDSRLYYGRFFCVLAICWGFPLGVLFCLRTPTKRSVLVSLLVVFWLASVVVLTASTGAFLRIWSFAGLATGWIVPLLALRFPKTSSKQRATKTFFKVSVFAHLSVLACNIFLTIFGLNMYRIFFIVIPWAEALQFFHPSGGWEGWYNFTAIYLLQFVLLAKDVVALKLVSRTDKEK